MSSTVSTADNHAHLANIPPELRTPALWLQYYLAADPKHPGKKPRKHPVVKYALPEDRKANLKPLDYLLEKRERQAGVQRFVDKAEGFTYIDIDRVRNPDTGEVQDWAQTLINELDTYCEVSASGRGFHLVVRATVEKDFHRDPDQVEIYAGNIPNKLIAMTGDVEPFKNIIEDRQKQLDKLLCRAEAREFNKEAPGASGDPLPEDGYQPDPESWRDIFHTGGELDQRPGRMFIEGILEEGITAIGSLSGVGKTWIGLSIAHAVITKEPLFGRFPVVERTNVLYLVPEMGGRKFRERMVKMRIPQDGMFFCQTVRDGAIDLSAPFLLQACNDMRPLVVLDTAIRFQSGDENSSTEQAQGLGAAIFKLINHGAASVILMHHRSKGAANEELTLENTLRGSTDFGAMCDCVWGLEHARLPESDFRTKTNAVAYLEESQTLTRLYMRCVKPRDMEPADPFTIQGRPHIDNDGDFKVVLSAKDVGIAATHGDAGNGDGKDEKIAAMFVGNTGINAICRALGVGVSRVNRVAREKGRKKNADDVWEVSLAAF